MLIIDGSIGEGGGQVLRTSLSLAAILGYPLRVERIRAGRSRPGLAPQHLAAIRALEQICGAAVAGASIGSPALEFRPAHFPRPGDYRLDISRLTGQSSAGAVSLIFQCLLPPLSLAPGPSNVALGGGTHVTWSPSTQYLEEVYLPSLGPMGLKVDSHLAAAGFYPRGGGAFHAAVQPAACLPMPPLRLTRRGPLQAIHILVLTAHLPTHVGRRMAATAARLLNAEGLPAAPIILERPSSGPGAALLLVAEYAHARAGFGALGTRGRPAEAVAAEACHALLEHHATEAAVDPHLADQLLLPAALAGGVSTYTVSRITGHLLTNADIIRRGLQATVTVDGRKGQPGTVTVAGYGLAGGRSWPNRAASAPPGGGSE
jgi:RNA 3'-terminal phosphate cyclase (ATP)